MTSENYGSFSYVCTQNFRNTVLFIFGTPYTTILHANKPKLGQFGNRRAA